MLVKKEKERKGHAYDSKKKEEKQSNQAVRGYMGGGCLGSPGLGS